VRVAEAWLATDWGGCSMAGRLGADLLRLRSAALRAVDDPDQRRFFSGSQTA